MEWEGGGICPINTFKITSNVIVATTAVNSHVIGSCLEIPTLREMFKGEGETIGKKIVYKHGRELLERDCH